jgi:O-antigen ligase
VLRIGAFALPLTFLSNIFDGFVLPKLLVARLLLLALATLWLLRFAGTGEVRLRRTRLDVPLLAFIGSAILSTVLAVNRNVALFGTYSRYEGLLTLMTYVALFWLVVQTLADADDARALVRWMFVSAYLVSVIAILQSVFGSLAGGGAGGETAFSFGGLVRADATFGNPNALATFLAMLLPPALDMLIAARSISSRVLAVNLLVVMSLALVLTFGRSAWVGAAVGIAVVLASRRPWRRPAFTLVFGASAVLLVALAAGAFFLHGGLPLVRSTLARALSISDVASGSGLTRLHIWRDTLSLVASRPVAGYGPDTFGLVYPQFQTGNWTPGFLNDKAHADVLQVAATQGLVGAAAYVWVIVAFVRAFWEGRAAPSAVAMLAGWIAYQIPTQVNFSFLPAALPFWIFSAAAVTIWGQAVPSTRRSLQLPRMVSLPIGAISALALVAVVGSGIVRPYAADACFFAGLTAQTEGRLADARVDVSQARALGPEQSAYAVEAGDLALDLDANGTPASDADWQGARQAYEEAARLGTFSPAAFRDLALADRALGRSGEALAAARRAVELDRFDPQNQALLKELTSS